MKNILCAIALVLGASAPTLAAPENWVETTYQCGYTVSVQLSNRDVNVEYKGIPDERGCRPLSVKFPEGSIRHYGPNRIFWEYKGANGTADSYANALAALPDEILIYLDPAESIVTKIWGF